MNTTENNKLIADFMDLKVVNSLAFFKVNGENAIGEMQYNSNWNWLMEVVLKINQFENQRFTVVINSMDCKIYDNERNKWIVDSYGRYNPDELIQAIYYCVSNFIKWHNQQTK